MIHLPINVKTHEGYCQDPQVMLHELGVTVGKCICSCHRKMEPNGPKDHYMTIQLLAYARVSNLKPSTAREIEDNLTSTVSYAAHSSLQNVMRDAYKHLKDGPYRLLLDALYSLKSTKKQWDDANLAYARKINDINQVTRRHMLF